MKIAEYILDLLFPARCILCRKFLDGGKPRICPACQEKLPCTAGGGRQKGNFFSACVSPLYYDGKFREAFLRYKFGGARAYAPALGRLLASCIYEELEGEYDLITWVPLNRWRKRRRGYDQTELLARAACRALNKPLTATLIKEKGIPAQSGIDAPEKRRANIAGAYRVIDEDLVREKRILVVDDIITTGSTLSECAKTLLLAGAEDVICASLARSKEEE